MRETPLRLRYHRLPGQCHRRPSQHRQRRSGSRQRPLSSTAGASPAELAVQEAQVRQAAVNVRQAQSAYDQIKTSPNAGALPQSVQLEQTTISYEVAQAQLTLTNSADEAQIAAAFAQIAQAELGVRQARSNLLVAQDTLNSLLEGQSAEDLERPRPGPPGRTEQTGAEVSLNNSMLYAPITASLAKRANCMAPAPCPPSCSLTSSAFI